MATSLAWRGGLVGLLGIATAAATPLDDYVSKPDPVFGWRATGQVIKTELGGTGYVLNVSSQRWLDVSRAHVAGTDIWSHQVVVVVPRKIKHRNISVAYLTGNCNIDATIPSKTDEELLLVDAITASVGTLGIIVYQIPNCPMVYPSDPSGKKRTEDAMIAWAWKQYLDGGDSPDPEWLPRLPMTKAAMQCMRAVQEWGVATNTATIEGWFVAGASKRGWTTWMVGAVTCPSCPTILGLAPLVPIVPSLNKEIHRMWQAYDGFTFAFADYSEVNLTQRTADPQFKSMLEVVDPINYGSTLARLPKLVVLSSDDEFMMMDWSNIWYDDLTGEAHLLIAPDSEHTLATGVPEVVESITAMVRSLISGHPRPSFDYAVAPSNGEISVTIPAQFQKGITVELRYAETLQTERRDFRWVRLASNTTSKCTLPTGIPLPKPLFGGNCLVPIVWKKEVLKPTANNAQGVTYSALPPKPSKPGRWVGYYIEVLFPGDGAADYHFTTPGVTWPNTLPFPDCTGEGCIGRLL